MNEERTFAMLKPGVLQRRMAGELLSRIEKKGLSIIALKLMTIPKPLAEQHYAEHQGKDFYPALIAYMTSGPVVAMVIKGRSAIAALRALCGATNPAEAHSGTIRGDYGARTQRNLIHASDSQASAEREIALFFQPEELQAWKDGNEEWI
ncbi:MAG TPA: nucleoside-diphosphate kinase [Spirochaetaceae bacterium]|jgi:nucleoside-diphosphate kinase|nr:nucleoside-diphosphate kinase [Spirochaetaceae bacterium]